jgi:hypothetical protein
MDTVVDLDEEALMSRLISLLLNYPVLADGTDVFINYPTHLK